MSLRVSEKHGLNPSMDTCFFCGEPRGLVLFGKLKNDAEAPRSVLLNYEPCDKCKELMANGTTLIEVDTEDNGSTPIQKGCYPTGRWCVVKKEAATRLFNEAHDKVLLAKQMYEKLIGGAHARTDGK